MESQAKAGLYWSMSKLCLQNTLDFGTNRCLISDHNLFIFQDTYKSVENTSSM